MAPLQKDEDNVLKSPLTLRGGYELVEEEEPIPAAGEGDDDEHTGDTETCSEPSHATGASWMGREWLTTHRKDDRDFPDQPRTSKSETKRRKSSLQYSCNVFWTWSAAAVWIMMALTVVTSSLAGAVCIGTEVELDKGEAALRCPLPVNASATRQGIIIKYFPTPDSADTVMSCYWPEEEGDKPECFSDTFSLVAPLTDQVVAEVPVTRLMDSGVYKCQLLRRGVDQDFIPCHIHRFSDYDEGKRPAVMTTPVVPSPAINRTTPGQDPLIREAPPCVGQCGSVALTAAVLVLQVIIIILLVINVLYVQNRKNLQGKNERVKAGWMTRDSSEKKLVTPEGKPMNTG